MAISEAPVKWYVRLSQRAPADLPAWSLWLMLGAIGIGAALRIYQFAADTSLWLDELAIANNLAERSLWSLLTEPLRYAQIAPPGFIAFEKAMFEEFGANDQALRLYSLVAGIAALGAISLVAVRIGLRETAWVAPLLLALGGPFIFQSVQVKPYAGDVCLSLALLALALRLNAQPDAKRTWTTALGMLAPWFSFPASLTLAGIGMALLLSPQRRKHFLVVALWGLSALAALRYASMLVDRGTAMHMQQFWSRNGVGFPDGVTNIVPWSLGQLRRHLWTELGLRGVTFWLGVAAIGVVALWRRSRFAMAVITAPILTAFLAATLHRYPLGGRLSHAIAALLIVLLAAAAADAVRFLQHRRLGVLAPVPGLAVAVLPLIAFTKSPPPYRVDDVKQVLFKIARMRKGADWLYVYPGAWQAYRYYGTLSRIAPRRVVFGGCPTASPREPLASLDSPRGNARVWVLFAHVTEPSDREFLLGYLDRIGVRRQSVSVPDPYERTSRSVDAHLYDLSDGAKLRNATWRTYRLARTGVPNELPMCESGMVPPGGALLEVERAGEVDRD